MAKKNQGFTLVELLVTISVGALVTLAATTVILMGLRLNRHSMGTATRQNDARVFLSAMEKMASDGSISGFHMDYENWEAYGKDGEGDVIYSYDSENQVISAKGTPLVEDVLSSYLVYKDGLLTVSIETEEGIFDSKIYCRTGITASGESGISGGQTGENEDDIKEPVGDELEDALKPEVDVPNITEADARKAFLATLISQYLITKGENVSESIKNFGVILDDGASTGNYFSEWYITSNWTSKSGIKAWESGTWNSRTPWCACFVTWGVDQVMKYTDYDDTNPRPYYAGVDSFMAYFKKGAFGNEWHESAYWLNKEDSTAEAYNPQPGDVIFYDWVFNDIKDPQHVGVVIGTAYEGTGENKIGYVYTIEGNVSNASSTHGVVGVRKYKLNDPRILGYGVLDWKNETENSQN